MQASCPKTSGDFRNGLDPKLLDVVRIPMVRPCPHGCQVENHLIQEGCCWSLVRKGTGAEARASIDRVKGPLWTNASSGYYGHHDRVADAEAANLDSSLKLIEVEDLQIEVAIEGAAFDNAKRKVRGHFSLNGIHYKLSVTDPRVERQFLGGDNGLIRVGCAVLCISLGEPYEGYAYELIAAVHFPPAGG